MQRLSENVMESVRHIKSLTASIRESTDASVTAAQEGNRLAVETATSARHIRLIVQQQQTAIEQVSAAMDDVAQVATQTSTGSKQISESTRDLADQARKLRNLVERFQLGGRSSSRGSCLNEYEQIRLRLIERFRAISLDRLQKLNKAVVELEHRPEDTLLAEEMLRDIHSLKGEARTMRFADVTLAAHRTEALMFRARDLGFHMPPELVRLILSGFDTIAGLLQTGEAKQDAPWICPGSRVRSMRS